MKWMLRLLSILPFLGYIKGELRAINAYGLETELAFQCGLSCCWVQPNEFYIQKIADMGFNAIRLPFSAEYIHRGDLTFMDQIIMKAGQLDLTIILDYHRTYASHQGNWYETTLPDFLQTWEIVLTRYYDYHNVKYVDIFNEFQDGTDKAPFWSDTMTQVILHLEDKFAGRWHYFVGGSNWGGSLAGIKVDVPATIQDRVSYTLHKYQFSVQGDYRHDYEISFGGYSGDKLFIGEFGWIQTNPQQVEWARMFLDYLKQKGVHNTALWCLSYYSGDTQGILKPNCLDVEQEKLAMLYNFWGKHPFRADRLRLLVNTTDNRLFYPDNGNTGFNYTGIDDEPDVSVVMDYTPLSSKYAPYYYEGGPPCHLRKNKKINNP